MVAFGTGESLMMMERACPCRPIGKTHRPVFDRKISQTPSAYKTILEISWATATNCAAQSIFTMSDGVRKPGSRQHVAMEAVEPQPAIVPVPETAEPHRILCFRRKIRRLPVFEGPAGSCRATDRMARERLPRAELPPLRPFNPPLSFTVAPLRAAWSGQSPSKGHEG